MVLEAGQQWLQYRLIDKIGEGGMGVVWRALDTTLDREVAIKVLPANVAQDADRLARFEREAKAVAALSHPNILSIFDFGVHEGQAFAVMELLEGETLRERLEQGALPVRKAIEYAVRIARGLAAAHDKGLVHRDLKPDNLFLLRDGQLKILDFGLARQTTSTPTSDVTQTVAAMTDPGTVLGTVGYMAPEQVRGQAVDGRSDLFALGTVLYEMLSGRRAFRGDTAADTLTAILKEDPPEFSAGDPEVPPALDRIIRHCLEKNAVERFQSARDVAFALEALSGSTTAANKALAMTETRGKLPRVALAALLVLAALVSGVLVGRTTAPSGSPPVRFTVKTFDPQSIGNARFMPDGETIVFSSAPRGNVPQLFTIRSGTLEAQPVGPPRTHLLSVSSKGELAVLTDARWIHHRVYAGTLSRMSIEGSPRPWMEGVREADWSPDGSTLAIVHDMGSTDRLEYPIGTVLYETAGYVSDPRVSPDGERVAFMDHQARGDDRGWVKVVDRAGKVITLAGEFWGEEGLAWSPDGSTVYFAADDRRYIEAGSAGDVNYQVKAVSLARPGTTKAALNSPGDFTIYDVAANGRWLATRDDGRMGVGVRVYGETSDRDLSWLNQNWGPYLTRDGMRLLFADGNYGANYAVAWRKTDGSPVVHIGEGNPMGWSPDGNWALAQIFSPPELVVYPIGAGEPLRLPRGALDQYQRASWFPDGKAVLIVGNEAGQPMRAYRQDLPDGIPTPLLDAGVQPAAITPDGKSVLGQDHERRWWWYPLDGGAARPALGMTAEDDPDGCVVGWSSDGAAVLVRTGSDVPARIERVEIATGRREFLREIAFADTAGLFHVQPTSVTHDGEQYSYAYWRRMTTLFVVTH